MITTDSEPAGYAFKMLINGRINGIEHFMLDLENMLHALFGPQRVLWQGWTFEDTTIFIFTIASPTAHESAKFIKLATTIPLDQSSAYFAPTYVSLSDPGTFKTLAEVAS